MASITDVGSTDLEQKESRTVRCQALSSDTSSCSSSAIVSMMPGCMWPRNVASILPINASSDSNGMNLQKS